jgi:hypothetical protein
MQKPENLLTSTFVKHLLMILFLITRYTTCHHPEKYKVTNTIIYTTNKMQTKFQIDHSYQNMSHTDLNLVHSNCCVTQFLFSTARFQINDRRPIVGSVHNQNQAHNFNSNFHFFNSGLYAKPSA